MADEWRWIGPDGSEQGGDGATLRRKIADGELLLTTNVWRAGFDGWKQAKDVPELAPVAMKTMPLATAGFVTAPAAPMTHPAFAQEDDAPTIRDNPIPEPAPAEVVPAPAPQPQQHWQAQPQQDYYAAASPAVAPAPAKKKGGLILTVLGALFGAFVLAGVGGLGVYAKAQADKAPDPLASMSPATSASGEQAKPKSGLQGTCSADHPKQLAHPVFGHVSLEVVEAGEERIAVGFAESKNLARVEVISIDDLEVKDTKKEPSPHAIAGVVPMVHGDDVKLEVDEENPKAGMPRTVPGSHSFTLLATPEGIEKKSGDEKPEMIWQNAAKATTAPRVEAAPGFGHIVALRRSGKVVAGWLDAEGDKKGELVESAVDAPMLGTPSVAASKHGALILVAARADEHAAWRIFAGHSAPLEVPPRLEPLALGEGDTSRISPSATPVGDAHWAVQWTEGAEDSHVVKVQLFDPKLAPVGQAVTVSAAGSDAGQGTLWTDGKRIVSLFLVSTGDSHELWAAHVTCK